MSGDFNALGVSGIRTGHPFAGHRTDRHTYWDRQRDRVSRPKQPRDEQGGGGEGRAKTAGSRQDSGPGRRSSLVPGIAVSIRVMSATCQMHACARGVLHCPPRADGVEAGTQALPSPQGLTLCDRQHQIRPAPRQGWQAISRTGAGDRGSRGRDTKGMWGQVQKEMRTQLHSDHRTMES